ncbi:MAG: hypothetical protein BEN18_00295 [Epulopiscium sp. Nuni2H_MBin001]|nr:MAG: hypothetical protein BEN18_00295 [Epulopiscium sp. Nuni2H_MBin001]
MILGIDGGNSKTDYFLFTNEGKLKNHIRAGTCSHERLVDGFSGSYRVIKENLDVLLDGAKYKDIDVAVCGLAGVDTKQQKDALVAQLSQFGFGKLVVDNDGFLGIKVGSEDGTGVCSINGTGTVTVGIDGRGNRLQVGGIGDITGDEAGGAFITRLSVKRAYSSIYRCEKKTEFTEEVIKLLKLENKDEFLDAISGIYGKAISHTPYVKLVFDYAQKGDEVALEIVDYVSNSLAHSVVGCVNNLEFGNQLTVILAGSVWTKPKSDVLRDAFKGHVLRLTDKDVKYVVLEVPPAVGAVLWAMEIFKGSALTHEQRADIVKQVSDM